MSSGLALEVEGGRWKRYPAYKDSGVEWLGAVPEGWEVKRLKHLCSHSALYGANEPATSYVAEGVRFLRTTDITDKGELLPENAVFLEIEQVKDYLLEDGDLLISRSGTIGRSFVHDASKHGQCAYAGYLVRFVPNDELYPRFAFYYTKTDRFSKYLSLSVIQSTIGNVNGQKYANMPLPTPPLPEQRAISAFLDRETGRIDALVAKKERQIDLLHEKRTALISHAVIKGLDPDAPTKDSGVEWLGEVPKGWKVELVKWFTAMHKQGYYTEQAYIDEGVKLARITDIDDSGNVYFENMPFVTISPKDESSFKLKEGDFLFARSGTIGRFGVVKYAERSVFASYLILFRFKSVEKEFLRYSFGSHFFKESLLSALHGGANQNVHAENIKEQSIAIPPLSEQYAIAAFLDRETGHIDVLTTKVYESISKLREYRTALISAAVTGKIDVRSEER